MKKFAKMGNSGSISQLQVSSNPQVHSTNSYYGTSELGDMTNKQIEEHIRNIQIERLQRRSQHMSAYETNVDPPHLKSLVAIGTPEPRIACLNNCYVVSFGLRAECSGTVNVIANDLKCSQIFNPVERVLVNLPIPVLGDFRIEVIPNTDNTQCDGNLLLVSKHTLIFRMVDDGTDIGFRYDKQILSIAGTDQAYNLSMRKDCKLHKNLTNTKCLLCLLADASVTIGMCGHKVACQQCMTDKQVTIQQCPICGASTVDL